jgi:hypothetical protein
MEKIRAVRGNADLRLPEGSFETFKKEIECKRSTEHLSHFCHSSGISGKNVH